jgi:hypothetical protein
MTVAAHDNNLAEAALAYARLGYAVFPCRPGGKPPATPHGCKDATTDEACIRAWWDRQPDANIGLATTGLLVVDIDGAENQWLADQPDRQRDLDAAPVSLTPGGGRHHLFRQPSGRTLGNSCGRLAPKVDTRGNGGYIVVPPSVVDGRAYQWASGSLAESPAELPEPPTWLADMLGNGRADAGPPLLPQVDDIEQRACAYLDAMPPAVCGQGGHNATYAAATAMVHGFGLPSDRALALLMTHYNPRCQPPWSEKELRHKVAEAAAKPHDRPHGWLRDQQGTPAGPQVDISALDAKARAPEPTEAAPVLTPLAIDIQTFAETPEREIVWLWEGVIPRGMVSLIGGKQGLGKSFLICDIAARISTGRPMPDGVGTAPGNVLLLAREDDASCVLRPRLRAAQADLERVCWSLFANAETDAFLDLAAHVGLLAAPVAERSIDLVVVDTFASFAPLGTDSNAGQDVRLLLDALTRLARTTGAAVVVVAHPRKSGQGEGDPMDAIAGSHQMTAGVRVASMLEKGPADGERWFRVVKSNLGRIDERGWTWRFAWPDPFTEGAADMPHLEWATAGDEVMAQSRTRPGCDPQAVRSALLELLADGPRTRSKASRLVAAKLRQTQSHVRIDDVALAIDRIVRDGDEAVETWDGPRNAQMIGLPGSRTEDPEDKALRLASEDPSLTVRELRDLAGCRSKVAGMALRVAHAKTGEDAP